MAQELEPVLVPGLEQEPALALVPGQEQRLVREPEPPPELEPARGQVLVVLRREPVLRHCPDPG